MDGGRGNSVMWEVKGRWLQQQKADAGRFVLHRITGWPGYHLYTTWAALYTDRSIGKKERRGEGRLREANRVRESSSGDKRRIKRRGRVMAGKQGQLARVVGGQRLLSAGNQGEVQNTANSREANKAEARSRPELCWRSSVIPSWHFSSLLIWSPPVPPPFFFCFLFTHTLQCFPSLAPQISPLLRNQLTSR